MEINHFLIHSVLARSIRYRAVGIGTETGTVNFNTIYLEYTWQDKFQLIPIPQLSIL